MRKEEQKALKSEIAWRRLLLKKLESPKNSLARASAAKKEKREARVAELSEYRTERDIQDAYGYDLITDDERRALLEALEKNERYVEDTKAAEDYALEEVQIFMNRLLSDICSLEFELLPLKEQQRIKREAEDFRARAEQRKSRER